MIWFSLAFLVVMNLVMSWRIQALKNSVAELTDIVRYYAMTGGTGKAKFYGSKDLNKP